MSVRLSATGFWHLAANLVAISSFPRRRMTKVTIWNDRPVGVCVRASVSVCPRLVLAADFRHFRGSSWLSRLNLTHSFCDWWSWRLIFVIFTADFCGCAILIAAIFVWFLAFAKCRMCVCVVRLGLSAGVCLSACIQCPAVTQQHTDRHTNRQAGTCTVGGPLTLAYFFIRSNTLSAL